MKILIVEDDKSTLVLLRMMLARRGWSVTGCGDSDAALKALGKHKFDWLVVDGQIAPMDGLELASRAKELNPEMGIVMVSGFYDDSDLAGRPIQRLFPKPVDSESLSAYLSSSPVH